MTTSPRAVKASARCTCHASITYAPVASGPGKGIRIPLDVDRDPAGTLVAVKAGKHPDGTDRWGVRLLAEQERAGARGHRYTPHWTTCPKAGQYAAIEHTVAPGTMRAGTGVRGFADRSGPCAKCRQIHPNHYGEPASPLCDPCRIDIGLPPIASHAHAA